MKDTTIELIRTVLNGDDTVTPELADHVIRACRRKNVQRGLIRAQQAMEILQVSRPTLRAYVKQGVLTQINYSSRKVRFDEGEVRALAYNGVSLSTSLP